MGTNNKGEEHMNSVIKESTEWNAWQADIEVAQKRTTNKMSGSYTCPEMTAPSVRIGADDHAQHPSRRGNKLFYKDGGEEKVTR